MRDARAAGLRPRSPSLALALAALVCLAILAGLRARAPGWIGAALERAFTQTEPALPDPSLAAAALLGVLATLASAAMLFHGRRASRRRLGVVVEVGEIPPWVALGSCVTALVLTLVWLRPAVAGAARCVDTPGLAGLWSVWSGWLGRGLLALALVAASVGVFERLVSARRLWQGLHLTRTQQRERARASGARARQR
ncbi:hypothetical protein DB30_06954 [Enhygromyxa salina]|uniref:Uncharacterized protein n=1 Tax=Enhygromyxa salina TaxID=215803 RepID=A0A0C2CX80_9BACT|nr:hypothetical protein [Enhygromyxa salina]KIG14205.1 hypothetical protein DB30_06954 [Enhygromyxa salina]